MFEKFIERLKMYKEILLAVTALLGALFFVRDYFATKEEVTILKCQVQNNIALLESRMNTEKLTKDLIDRKKELAEAEGALKTKADALAKSEGLIWLNIEVDRLAKEREEATKKEHDATDNFKPGICEEIVRKK